MAVDFQAISRSARQRLLDVIDGPDWRPFGTHLGIAIEAKPYPDASSSINVFMGAKEVNGSPHFLTKEIWDLASSLRELQAIDKAVAELEVIELIGDELKIIHVIAALPWPVWDRDMLYLFAKGDLPAEQNNGVPASIICGATVDHPLRPVGSRRRTVRMQVGISGWKIEPLDGGTLEKATRSRAIRVVHGDPSGNIPSMVINNQARAQVSGMLEWLSHRQPCAKL